MQNKHTGFGGRQGWMVKGGREPLATGSIKTKYFESVSDSKNTSKYYLFGLLPNVKEKAHNFECLLYREHCAINFT